MQNVVEVMSLLVVQTSHALLRLHFGSGVLHSAHGLTDSSVVGVL